MTPHIIGVTGRPGLLPFQGERGAGFYEVVIGGVLTGVKSDDFILQTEVRFLRLDEVRAALHAKLGSEYATLFVTSVTVVKE